MQQQNISNVLESDKNDQQLRQRTFCLSTLIPDILGKGTDATNGVTDNRQYEGPIYEQERQQRRGIERPGPTPESEAVFEEILTKMKFLLWVSGNES